MKGALCLVFQMSGIRDLVPGSVIDATMFNPCGYSMNGMKTDVSDVSVVLHLSCQMFALQPCGSARHLQGTYWTIHITPEPEFSYVSFETNLSQTSYDDLIRKVVEVFKPGKFVTTLFVNQVCVAAPVGSVAFVPLFGFFVFYSFCFLPSNRAPNVAVSSLLPRNSRATSVSTASWLNSMITILSSQATPRIASRTSRAEG